MDSDLRKVNKKILHEIDRNATISEFREAPRSMFDATGKQMRPRLVLLVNKLLTNHTTAEALKISCISEMIHTASLMHDDIIDNSELRRNKPTTHIEHGVINATILGDFLVGIALKVSAQLNDSDVDYAISQVINDLITGEVYQRKDKKNPNVVLDFD